MRIAFLCASALALSSAACGGGGSDGGTNPPPPAPVATVTLSAAPATLNLQQTATLTATTKDASGNTLTGRTITWVSSQPTMLSVTGTGSTVTLTGLAPGSATVTATSETKTATTAAITITNTTQTFPTTATVTIADNSFTPNRVDIQTNGTVTWNWTGATAHNVTFGTGPSTVTSISQKSTGTDSRTFPSVGTYNYECTLHPGMTATVVTHAP